MSEQKFQFGMDDEQLKSTATIYSAGLLQGKRLLISGGGSGIGKATAWLAGRLGGKIVLCGRTPEKLDTAALAMREAGIDVVVYSINIREPEAVQALFNDVWREQGPINILVNSAGGQFPQPSIDYSPNGWRAVVDTNLNGTWFMMQAAAQRWRDAKMPGNIINLVVVIDRGMWGMSHSCAARAGVIYASKSVAMEWAPLSIRVNCIAPGPVATEGMRVYPDGARERFVDSNPMRRFASPWEIAESCVYMASDASGFMTGEVMTLDGGGRLWGDLWPLGKPEYYAT